ncbi:histidine decarboxylase, pyruvoyl type [Shewanella marina]|uniref:histidine decarboxylase, pyruvoyl type n=1 Tax=Shewanella marina TaxID=487319 RepID=UPI000564EA37|nr:histidine decarboxylase, pyruvoyl type [Shewanella marina]
MKAPKIDKTAISPFDDYCDGYGCPGAQGLGYVSVLKVSTGTVKKTDDTLLDGIVTYDKGECADAYVGQINMLTASSFCGLAGQVWGHDIAIHEDIYNNKIQPLFSVEQYNGSMLDVYDAAPLIEAGKNLFGTESNRRFPLLPGSHVICANKSVTAYRPQADEALKEGEGYGVWSFIAISLSADRDHCSDLFIEDAGIWTKNDSEEDLKAFLEAHRKAVVWSVTECGNDSHVVFDRTYVAFSYSIMKPGEIGTAVTVAPYATLARKAVPSKGFYGLNDMQLNDWLADLDLPRIK